MHGSWRVRELIWNLSIAALLIWVVNCTVNASTRQASIDLSSSESRCLSEVDPRGIILDEMVYNMEIINKKNDKMLESNLSHSEFRCKCKAASCTRTLYDPVVGMAFQRLRVMVGKPITINSGYRCQKHNEKVGGGHMSFHKVGMAIDLANPMDDIYEFAAMAKEFFSMVIVYEKKNFIHCDVRSI
jgi:zinc D-Ala-D-Ala carboxypeptidase